MRGQVVLLALLGSAAGHAAAAPVGLGPATAAPALGPAPFRAPPESARVAPVPCGPMPPLAPSPYGPERVADPYPHSLVPIAPASAAGPASGNPRAAVVLAPSPYGLGVVSNPYEPPGQPWVAHTGPALGRDLPQLALAPSPYERPSGRLAPDPY